MVLKTSQDTYENVDMKIHSYLHGNGLALSLNVFDEKFNEDSLYDYLTVCIEENMPPYTQCIDINNVKYALDFIEENKLGVPICMTQSGFCTYPIVLFNPDRLLEIDEKGLMEYEVINNLTTEDRENAKAFIADFIADRNKQQEEEIEQPDDDMER